MPPDHTAAADNTGTPSPIFAIQKARTRFFGLTFDETIRVFFGGNAFVAVIVLALITFFLFREGSQFFGQNRDSLRTYRLAGLEYVDIIRQQEEDHTALTRYLFDIRLKAVVKLTEEGVDAAEAKRRLAKFDDYAERYGDTIVPVRGLVSELTEVATDIKTRYNENEDYKVARQQFLASGMKAEAEAIVVKNLDFSREILAITGTFPAYEQINTEYAEALKAAIAELPVLPVPELQPRLERFRELNREYLATFPTRTELLKNWNNNAPVGWSESFTQFIFGTRWLTASFWQDWYGIIPLFVGSLMISAIALFIAVPLGVGAAIYVNQIATPQEQKLIKPAIEFISAIPSVVLGFFGIAVLGQALRALSQWEALSWVPGFPYSERLNALTAGCLLALIAVPTIFTLAEDAINNVPRAFKEASFALGASRMQTIVRIIVPAALSGIVSAVLLGLGRVMGETMVVLLCAGNRIAIPDFTAGITAFVQPVHTMTGIIAQEMGEVVRGGIHYRALFVVGLVLFFIALLLNFLAQKIVRKYRISIG
ncbi:MAG: phosphate ABC transporter permease subunit PstC [Verrucomicrobia bacterium]|nr:phosphate ABC transporter permease subunit PstC [Verrucomicrobiota bacterium]